MDQKSGGWVNVQASDGVSFQAYEARPLQGAKGAVVVLQEIFGLNGHIRNVVDGYAQEGYCAIAPALFHRVEPGVELGYSPDDMQRGLGLKAAAEALQSSVLGDVQACIDRSAMGLGTGQSLKVGVVGYCWGGLMTWRAATRLQGVAAAVPYYGGGMHTELEHAVRCPTMAHLSDNDNYVPMQGVQALQKAHPEVLVHLYSAKHGFNCDERAAYDAHAAALARSRTFAFFEFHLSSRAD